MELKGEYFGKTGLDLGEADMGCVLSYIYSYTINSPEFRPKLRKSLDDIIWDRVALDEFGLDARPFEQQATSMLDQLDAFHSELFEKKPSTVD